MTAATVVRPPLPQLRLIQDWASHRRRIWQVLYLALLICIPILGLLQPVVEPAEAFIALSPDDPSLGLPSIILGAIAALTTAVGIVGVIQFLRLPKADREQALARSVRPLLPAMNCIFFIQWHLYALEAASSRNIARLDALKGTPLGKLFASAENQQASTTEHICAIFFIVSLLMSAIPIVAAIRSLRSGSSEVRAG